MARPRFSGVINLDVRESTPDWEPYKQPEAPEGAPSILYIVLDDVGYSSMSCYGGLIETPTFDRLAEKGLRYTQWHTTALCSPTRSCLLTGRNHTTNGMACIAEAASGFPNANGHIPFECATIAEVLSERGYNTYMLGKWHLCPVDEVNMASTKRNWPNGRGFERFYGFLGGETNQWYPDLVYDNHPVEQPRSVEEGYHLTEDLADEAIRFIRDSKVIAPSKPFLMYFAPGACHAPHQVPREWIEKYRGRFDMGFEKYRELVLERQKKMGIVPEDTELPPLNPIGTPETRTGPDGQPFPSLEYTRPWDTLSDDEKRLFCRMAEVWAAFLSHTDYHVGRIIEYLEESGQLDNTIVVLVSDNGASAEGGPNGSVNENKFFNNIPDSLEENLKHIDELGGPRTYNHMPNGWAMAFNAPFKMWKRYTYNGGVCDPCIIHWPAGIAARGEIRHQYHHAVDIVPTIYECLGMEMPEEVKGYTQWPIEGASMRYSFEFPDAPSRRQTQFYSMLGSRGIYHDGWKAVTTHPTVAGWGNFSEDVWELYHIAHDRSEIRSLVERYPDKVREMVNLWFHEAGKYQGLPLEDRTAMEILTVPRPQMVRPRDHYIYYPDSAQVPEAAAVNIRRRSYTIMAEVDISDGGAEGVLFSMGSVFGGHSLYVKDRRLHYVYNWLGEVEQRITSDVEVPVGRGMLAAAFDKTGDDEQLSALGTLTLYINEQKVGEAEIKTQPGNFALGEGLNVGRDDGQEVTRDYKAPFEFRGGTIKHVIVDVSGEPFVDLEKEAVGMMARE